MASPRVGERVVVVSTISDVARAAGVSVATVSRALRGLGRVNPATRARIIAVAKELNYVASPTATSLASGRTMVVGITAPTFTRWFFATLVSAIGAAVRVDGYQLLLFDLERNAGTARAELTAPLLSKRVDGLVSLNVPMTDAEQTLIEKLGLPLVAVGEPVAAHPFVQIDDAAAVRTATEHVISLGHSRIGYAGAAPKSGLLHTPSTRLGAFRDTLDAHGLTWRDDWFLDVDWTAGSSKPAAAACLTAADRPTAFVAASDELAFGILLAARDVGLDVPRDLSVVGIDDHELAGAFNLSTMRQDVVGQGRLAAEMLLALMAGEPADGAGVTFACDFVRRASSAPPP